MLIFAHPLAFETRSALYRAVELCARGGAPCTVCLVGPTDAAAEWFDTPLAWTARRNGLGVYLDFGGVEADRFAAKTSGVCLVYDARGRLCFLGDIIPLDGESRDAGVKAALDGLSHIRANSDKLIVRPVTGRRLDEF